MAARSRLALVSTALVSTALVFTAVVLFLFSNFAIAQDSASTNARLVRLSMVDGDVLMQKADEQDFQKAFLNMPVGYASRVWARDGAAEIELENGSTIRLTPDSQVTFEELSGDDSGYTATTIAVQQGLVYFDARPHSGDRFSVRFGQETVALHQRVEFRLAVANDQFEIAVLSGELEVNSDAPMRVPVRKGETLAFDPQDESRYFLTQEVARDSYDGWDQDRHNYRDQYARPEVSSQSVENIDTQNVAEQEQPTDSTSTSTDSVSYVGTDLNYYGTYFTYVGYGIVWRPRYFPVNWNPYANGAWVFEPGIGYVWVSAYPWGWAPFHYGSWIFVPATGWCWHPGNRSHRRAVWNPSVRLLNPPTGTQIAAKPTAPATPGKIIPVGSGLAPQRGAMGFQQGMSRLPVRRANAMAGANRVGNTATPIQQSDMPVSRRGAHVFQNHVFQNNDPVFTSNTPASSGNTDASGGGTTDVVVVPVPVEGVVQGTVQGPNSAQSGNRGRWVNAATSPSNFSAATSPGSFSAATSPGNIAATSGTGVTAATSSQAVNPPGGGNFAVVPVFVPAQQGQDTPTIDANQQQRQHTTNQQPYPLYHTLPAVRTIPAQQNAVAPQQSTTVPQQHMNVPQQSAPQTSPAHGATNGNVPGAATHQMNAGAEGGVSRSR